MKKSAKRKATKPWWDTPVAYSALLYTGLAIMGIFWSDFGKVFESLGF